MAVTTSLAKVRLLLCSTNSPFALDIPLCSILPDTRGNIYGQFRIKYLDGEVVGAWVTTRRESDGPPIDNTFTKYEFGLEDFKVEWMGPGAVKAEAIIVVEDKHTFRTLKGISRGRGLVMVYHEGLPSVD